MRHFWTLLPGKLRTERVVELFDLNRDLVHDRDARIELAGTRLRSQARVATLTAFNERNRVAISNTTLDTSGNTFTYQFPAHFVSRFQFDVQ